MIMGESLSRTKTTETKYKSDQDKTLTRAVKGHKEPTHT